MVDHDQRFKELLREFLTELVALFLPWLTGRLRTRTADWQKQDVFTNPPLGLVRRVDLLARVPEVVDKETTTERLLHFEVEAATSLTEVRHKIGHYYPNVQTTHNCPVTCLALYLQVGLGGEGWDEYAEYDPDEGEAAEPVYRVRWRYVGLPGLPAERYLPGDNWLGVALAALMRIEPERKPWLRAELLRRLATECKENDYRKLLLITCVETYLPLEGQQELEFLRLLKEDARYQETQTVLLTTYDRGRADGMTAGMTAGETKGRRSTLQDLVLRFASRQCGSPDESTRAQLLAIEDLTRLDHLVDAAPTAQSWEQLLAIP